MSVQRSLMANDGGEDNIPGLLVRTKLLEVGVLQTNIFSRWCVAQVVSATSAAAGEELRLTIRLGGNSEREVRVSPLLPNPLSLCLALSPPDCLLPLASLASHFTQLPLLPQSHWRVMLLCRLLIYQMKRLSFKRLKLGWVPQATRGYLPSTLHQMLGCCG